MRFHSLVFLFLFFGYGSLHAQLQETPRYFVDLDAGYNRTGKGNPLDEAGDGLYITTSFQQYFSLGARSGLSVGLGAYLHAFDYLDASSLVFACDLPAVQSGMGRRTFFETSLLHAGLSLPIRYRQWLGRSGRWSVQVGGDILLPLYDAATVSLFECGTGPAISSSQERGGIFRTFIPQLTAGLSYGIPTPHPKGEVLGLGPFFSFSPISHLGQGPSNADNPVYTVGLRMSGYRVRR